MTEARNAALLSVRGLSHTFSSGRWGRRGRPSDLIPAVREVSFDLDAGNCLAVVGESGSGKTTLARCILRLIEPQEGEIFFRGADVLRMSRDELLTFRKKAQIVFQDPYGSLNPRMKAGNMLEEILRVHGKDGSAQDRRKRVDELLELVGLHPDHRSRYPHEFSGGQRQRLGIARALSVDPELLVLDEPVSALDLSVQAQVLNLLKDLQERLSLTVILVAHDLAVVRQMADEVAVMQQGQILEFSSAPALFSRPSHPYTRGLLETVGSEVNKR